jgi:hypothetical protein
MAPGELHIAYFPFGGRVGNKLRPVLLLTGPLGAVPEVLVAYITSVFPTPLLATDIVLDPVNPDHASTNIKAKSLLRLHKLATIHGSDLARLVGKMSPTAWTEVEDKLGLLLNL